jgi:alkylglycerol monooxygenase
LYCLDKNYGGVLIIWDRIFGTFAHEKEGEEIVYGLVFNQPSFNPVWLQVRENALIKTPKSSFSYVCVCSQYFYSVYVAHKWQVMEGGWVNKLSVLFKGPSWAPGSPWTGWEADKIKVGPRPKFDVSIPTWCNIYLLVHFSVVVFLFQELYVRHLVSASRSKLLIFLICKFNAAQKVTISILSF